MVYSVFSAARLAAMRFPEMRRLTRYILTQIFLPFAITACTLTILLTLPTAIQVLNIIVINGQSFATYLEILSYWLIAALPMALPLSLFIALIYALYNLDSQNEITAMFALGFSRRNLMRPAMIFGLFVAIVTLLVAFYPRPWSERLRRVKLYQVRADIASTMLRAGAFTNPAYGITAFIRKYDLDGQIHGILFQDSRDRDRPLTYIAETGALLRSQTGARLVMFNGIIQQNDRARENGLTILSFDKYSYDLSALMGPVDWVSRKARELYPGDLFFPPDGIGEKDRVLRLATGHRYLVLVLHCLIFTLLALDAIAPARGSRHDIAGRIVILSFVMAAIQVLGVIFVQQAKKNSLYIPLLYLTPIVIYLLSRLYMILNPFRLKSFSAGSFRPGAG